MERLQAQELQRRLNAWSGRTVYVHLEVNPGAYWRNGAATLTRAHVMGIGPSYRVYLEFADGDSLIHTDDVTHMELTDDLLIAIGFDEHERLARTLEVSLRPLPMKGGEEG